MAAPDAHDRILTEYPDSPSVYSPANVDDESASTIRAHLQYDSDLDDDASHRISLRGPKIRFHSRAPWETDEVCPHSEEPDKSATVGSKLREKASRADTLMRTFTRGSFITGRPSIDSARSQTSFDITAGNYSSSRGALYDLAKESMSTLSLASTASSVSVRQERFARSIDHPKPPHYFTHGSMPLDGMYPPECGPMLRSSSDDFHIEPRLSSSTASSSQERQSRDDFVHPYANPDLVVPYTQPTETIPSHRLISGDMSGSDSNSTVADSTSVRSAAFSVISNETSTSSTSRDHPYGNPRVNGKEISSPISVHYQSDTGYVDRNTRFLSLHPPPPAFDVPHQTNPRLPVTLITLQEAQARERVRGNTTHVPAARTKLPPPDVDDVPETMGDQAEQMDTVGILPTTRSRSSSAGGTRRPTVPFPPAQISETGEDSTTSTSTNSMPGRALKHKKSGFMRLFTGRTSEGDKERSPPPSIPPLVDTYVKQSLQIHGVGKTSKTTFPRMTKPSSSPALYASNVMSGEGPDGRGFSSRRRQPPSLSIITKSSDHTISSPATGGSFSSGLNFTTSPSFSLTVPQSAPPGDTDFPGLKLRPVSTSFSSHFADMVAGSPDTRQRDIHTPSSAASSNTALSPFTPASMRRSDDVSATPLETVGEEHLTIEGLQEQFISAKKAWQQQIWELRGQIRDLTSELEDLRATEHQEYCDVCGRGNLPRCHASPTDEQQTKKVGIVNRPRVRTGDAARFASGN